MTNQKSIFFLFSISVLTFIIYFQGIESPFLYDDFINLTPLDKLNNDLTSIINFIFGNSSGPLGRPVSMFSFLLNKQNWPTDPTYFKATNIAIHLVCGSLIYILLKILVPKLDSTITKRNVEFISLSTATFWLLHPLHVSTTLYVIQRMTQLSMMFSLLAVIAFLKYSSHLSHQQKILNYLWPSLVMTVLISLAVLSKENALLVFPAILAINHFYPKGKTTKSYKVWISTLFILPSIICCVAILSKASHFPELYEIKHFSLGERLLTESRVVSHYLLQILLPNFTSMSIFHDDFKISISLFNPITTLLSTLFLSALLSLLFFNIKKIYKFSISWFFIWHMMESTFIPLDIYFEHRNYIASIGPLLGLSHLIVQAPLISGFAKVKPFILAVIYSSLLSIQLVTLTTKWSNEESLYTHWLTNHEESRLTFFTYVQYYIDNNMLPVVNSLLESASKYKLYSDDVDFYLLKYTIQCVLKENTTETIRHLKSIAKEQTSYKTNSLSNYNTLIGNVVNDSCKPSNVNELHKILSIIKNTAPLKTNSQWLANSHLYHSYIYLHSNEPEKALKLALQSQKTKASAEALIKIIEINMLLSKQDDVLFWKQKAVKFNKKHRNTDLENFLKNLPIHKIR